jgi:choline dehydrogenase-like flavoprotein
MSDQNYDVVIVGAGVAGAVLAKVLSSAGKNVLLLEAGKQAGIELEAVAAYANYQSYLNNFYMASAKVPNAPYPNLSPAPSPNVLDLGAFDTQKPVIPEDNWPKKDDSKLRLTSGYFVQKGELPFGSDYARAPGGTMLHWLGTTLRMLPHDFKIKTTYGHGVDWPISYEDLKPYYEMAEREIGVSGETAEQDIPGIGSDYFGPSYTFPMHKIPQSYLDGKFIEGIKGKTINVNNQPFQLNVISTPQGRNSTPNKDYKLSAPHWDAEQKRLSLETGREEYQPVGSVWDPYTGQRCEGNASCVPICPVQAKYNPLKTIKSAVDRLKGLSENTTNGGSSSVGSIDIITQAVASKIEFDTQGRIREIKYKQYKNPDGTDYVEKSARGRIYALAAHTVENAKLLLASGACKSNDQLGRNLMDHTTGLAWGLMPNRIGSYRGPGSTSNIPSFRDGPFRSQHGPFIMPIDNWGWTWPMLSPVSDFLNAVNGQGVKEQLFGKKLRSFLSDRLQRQFNVHFECEQMPEYTNRVSIHPRFKDALGNYRPVITYDINDYTRAAFAAGRQVSKEIFKLLSVQDETTYNPGDPSYFTFMVDGKEEGFVSNGAGHLAGTHRMGNSAADSVVNSRQQAWDHENLYLVGCGSMVTIGTSNPSLTMTALSFWAAENILKDLS